MGVEPGHDAGRQDSVRLELRRWRAEGADPELAHLAFVQRAEIVVLLGPSGVGKTHIALALGQRAAIAGHKVRFISAADLMLQLAAAKAQGRLKEYFNRAVLGPKLMIVDEIDLLRRSGRKVGQI
jgi:DNA replication protein DnaC